jgi:hypothetical protein
MLALAHSMLFSTLILIDPFLSPSAIEQSGPTMIKRGLRRRLEWPSREEAEEAITRSYPSWEPRVLERMKNYGLFPYPQQKDITEKDSPTPTRLTTVTYQELINVVRPAFIYTGDLDPPEIPWASEALLLHRVIDFIPCSTVYICGSESHAATLEAREDWVTRTGTGSHMGRAMRPRRVEQRVLPGVSHYVPMEAPTGCAQVAADWIHEEVKAWEVDEEFIQKWRVLTPSEKEERTKEWMTKLKINLSKL